MNPHTPGPWRRGKVGDSVVADVPVHDGPDGADAVDYYGGHLIAESVAPCNNSLIVAAPELLKVARAAAHALRSYQFGNASPDLAQSCAAALDSAIATAEGRS